MAAGQGFKTFTTGEVLTAGDVNGYLMQGVLVFASAAARDAAITAPQEGQFAYTKDTNGLWYYDGATWVASGATGDIEGVTAGTGISGGGTSGTVTITNSMATAITTKGDLIVGTGSGTFVRQGIGTNGQVLTADSAEADGLKWASPTSSAPSWTQISDTRVLGVSSHTVSSLGTYNRLYIALSEVTPASGTRQFVLTFNGSSAAVYKSYRFLFSNATAWDPYVINSQGNYNSADTKIELANASSTVGVNGVINVDNMLSANHKVLNYAVGSSPINGARSYIGGSTFAGSAITEFNISFVGANISDGRVIVYGSTN
jgi:hypothetical protein